MIYNLGKKDKITNDKIREFGSKVYSLANSKKTKSMELNNKADTDSDKNQKRKDDETVNKEVLEFGSVYDECNDNQIINYSALIWTAGLRPASSDLFPKYIETIEIIPIIALSIIPGTLISILTTKK